MNTLHIGTSADSIKNFENLCCMKEPFVAEDGTAYTVVAVQRVGDRGDVTLVERTLPAVKFKADLEVASRRVTAIIKLSEIIEWRLGKTHNNQALINDIVAAGLLDIQPPTLACAAITVASNNHTSKAGVLTHEGLVAREAARKLLMVLDK